MSPFGETNDAVQLDSRTVDETHAIEPVRRDVHTVLLRDELRGRIIERPHAFFGMGRAGDGKQRGGEE